jgi:hypothetical protein
MAGGLMHLPMSWQMSLLMSWFLWSWFGGTGGFSTCSALDPKKELTWEDIGCDMKKHYDMMSISLVNKKFLQQLQGYDHTVHK